MWTVLFIISLIICIPALLWIWLMICITFQGKRAGRNRSSLFKMLFEDDIFSGIVILTIIVIFITIPIYIGYNVFN